MITESKPMLESNTMQIAALVAVLGAIETQFSMLQGLLGEWYGLSYIVLSVVMVVLRLKTTKAIA